MPRHPAASSFAYSFGPGPLSPAVKWLIGLNTAVFILTTFLPGITVLFGLSPAAVFERGWIWQPVTYMFVHGGLFHVLFNMLALWMFGVELERLWGTIAFLKYYAVTGLGAAATMLVAALLPFQFSRDVYYAVTVGASGAIYGLLLAYARMYPNRPIYMYMLFPIPAKYFVMIIGAISFLSAVGSSGGGVAHGAHLGGLLCGYVYLKGGPGNLTGGLGAEIKYRYLKWKMNRLKKKFDVYSGGRRNDWNRRVH